MPLTCSWGKIFLILFIALLGLFIVLASFLYPSWKAAKDVERLEEDFPLLLRLCQVNLNLLPFEKALASATESSALSRKAFRPLVNSVASGKDMISALSLFSQSVSSLSLSRAALQLSFAYQSGNADSLGPVATELQHLHRQRLRAFSSQVSFLSAWFVVLSTLAPALFFSYALVGSAVLSFTLSGQDVLIAFFLVFPSILSALVIFAFATTPGGPG